MAADGILQKLGRHFYGKPDGHLKAQRLPFGLYLKYNEELELARNESSPQVG